MCVTGRIMGSPVAGRRYPLSLSGAYLQDYASYGYKISLVDRSHQWGSAVHMNRNSCLLKF